MYDKPSGYTLRENADALNETIRQFAGSFDRDGEAVQGGFNAASELTPLMSNPEVCERVRHHWNAKSAFTIRPS
jgi:hypothetical protein